MNMAVHICSFHDGDFRLLAPNGKEYLFSHSDHFGPLLIGKEGEELEPPVRESHPFWQVYDPWLKQGKRVCPNGYAVWRPDPISITTKQGRRRCYRSQVHQPDRCCLLDGVEHNAFPEVQP